MFDYDDDDEHLSQEEIFSELTGEYLEFAKLVTHFLNSVPRQSEGGFELKAISTNLLSKSFKEEISKKIMEAEVEDGIAFLELENEICLEIPNDVFESIKNLFIEEEV